MDWRDMQLIVTIADKLITEDGEGFRSEEQYYTTVLDRYNEAKAGK